MKLRTATCIVLFALLISLLISIINSLELNLIAYRPRIRIFLEGLPELLYYFSLLLFFVVFRFKYKSFPKGEFSLKSLTLEESELNLNKLNIGTLFASFVLVVGFFALLANLSHSIRIIDLYYKFGAESFKSLFLLYLSLLLTVLMLACVFYVFVKIIEKKVTARVLMLKLMLLSIVFNLTVFYLNYILGHLLKDLYYEYAISWSIDTGLIFLIPQILTATLIFLYFKFSKSVKAIFVSI